MSSTEAPDPRATPVQPRALERVDKLLDATAQIIEERGIAGLTTSAVAEESRSSVGVVYRYFPNVDALLLALADRNRARFLERVGRLVRDTAPADWQGFVRANLDCYADLAREGPGPRIQIR